MKKILLSFFLFLITVAAIAQTQKDLDKAMQEMQEMMKNMSPEEKKMVEQYTKGVPTSVNDMKNTKPSAQTSGQEANKPSDIGTKTSKSIGPAGGIIKSANGKITLNFPAGALAQNTIISIEETENTAKTGCGNAFDLLPDGLTFTKPVKMTLKYTNEEIEGAVEEELFVCTESTDGALFLNITSVVDTIAHTITANINHFSKWSLTAKMKLKILPQHKTLTKGQSVNLNLNLYVLRPINYTNKKEALDKYSKLSLEYSKRFIGEFKEDVTDLMKIQEEIDKLKLDLEAGNEKFAETVMKLRELNLKMVENKIEKEKFKQEVDKAGLELTKLGVPPDDRLNFMFYTDLIDWKKNGYVEAKIIDWKLSVPGVKAPLGKTYGTLIPQGLTAKYIAPDIIPSNKKRLYIIVKYKPSLKGLFPWQSKKILETRSVIDLNDESYLNYTFDGKQTNTLQFGVSSTYIKNMQQNAQKTMEIPISQCFLVDGELIISSSSSFMSPDKVNKIDIVYFKIKNPKVGQNFIKCDDESSSFRNDTRMSVQSGVKGEQFTNSQYTRWWAGNTCEGKDNCVPFEFNITEYNPVNDGAVSGSFSGKVYEDKDLAKSCSNSISHFISGDFSLKIQTNPENRPEMIIGGDEDLVPLVRVPKTKSTTNPAPKPTTKPKPKPKPKEAEIKAWD